ncbi:MAG: hypothetical protein K6E98_05120 [Lachnospiraceae bacterium]|nr:hypothetical protein [Lachnospiraceae bacterium]
MDIMQRLEELARRSYNNSQYLFTDFLSMAELSQYYEHERELSYSCPVLYGGCEAAERRMIRFGSGELLGYEQDFPITALRIRPVQDKFAEELNHRDYLGALMNLGIKREMLGDIFIKDKSALVFCKDSIAGFVPANLTRVRHTSVIVEETEDFDDFSEPEKQEKMIQVSSARIDAVISRVYNLSRQEALALFLSGLVYLNGRSVSENAKQLRTDDIVSVRGRGKFEFGGEINTSKKGKLNCRVRLYV